MTENLPEGFIPMKCRIWTHRKHPGEAARRVLVVDDYKDAADSICMVLGLIGYDTQVEYRGRAAIDTAAGWKPQVVLLDISMPGMSGLEVAQQLRATEPTSEAVLIAHSAMASDEDLGRARAAGFDAFCAKPTDVMHLGSLIRYFLVPAAS